ncbi:MAG TPA: hypothetical protein VLL31_04005, partial [Sulfurovum sp.]|nr:hypothetical protein [Sulfurovum sp.]
LTIMSIYLTILQRHFLKYMQRVVLSAVFIIVIYQFEVFYRGGVTFFSLPLSCLEIIKGICPLAEFNKK